MNKFSHIPARWDQLTAYSALTLSIVGILCLIGITRDSGNGLSGNDQTFLSREVIIQSAALVIGITVAAVILMLGYRYFIDLEKIIYISSLILLLSVYVPGLGASVNGSRSWIDLGLISFQPAEAVKISFVLLMASYLSRSAGNFSEGKDSGSAMPQIQGIIKAALYGLPFILLVSKEDFGSGCVFCAIWIFMVFCSGLELKMIIRLAMVFTILLPMFYFFLAGYQKDRIDAFLRPNDLDLPGNYQVWNSKVAIGSGGFFGKGLTGGTQSITHYAQDMQGALVAAGLSGMFFFQAFENIAMTMGLMPVTGITLPFMSYGGSSMLSSWMGVGLLLSVSCRQKL